MRMQLLFANPKHQSIIQLTDSKGRAILLENQ